MNRSAQRRPVQGMLAMALCAALQAGWAPTARAQGAGAAMAAPPEEATFTVTRFEITGNNPLEPERAEAVLRPYLGPQRGLARLQEAVKALERLLQENGFGLYRVVLPPQDADGTIRLAIEPIRLVGIRITGNKVFDEGNIRRAVPGLREHTSPDMRAIARQLAIANESGARTLLLRLSESLGEPGVDATLEVTERSPWTALVNLNNSGTSDTGTTRLVGVLQHHNLFNRDHFGSVAWTTAPGRTSDVNQAGLNYRVPFYEAGGTLAASYSYSSVNSGALGSGQVITGRGSTAGLTWTHTLHPVGDYRSNLVIGLEDKLFRAARIGGVVLPSGDVRSRPWTIEYAGRSETDAHSASGSVAWVRNWASGRNNDDAAYAANRVGASADWQAWRFGWSLVTRLPAGWALQLAGRSQFARAPLISGEQFGAGGANSVRGFNERAITGDRGASLSVEAWTPQWVDNLRLLGFFDAARVVRLQSAAGVPPIEAISSLGLGLRYTLPGGTGALSLDLGRVLQGSSVPLVTRGSTRLHASFTARF